MEVFNNSPTDPAAWLAKVKGKKGKLLIVSSWVAFTVQRFVSLVVALQCLRACSYSVTKQLYVLSICIAVVLILLASTIFGTRHYVGVSPVLNHSARTRAARIASCCACHLLVAT